jgi:peptide-methionine (S)-S-oxide reductase
MRAAFRTLASVVVAALLASVLAACSGGAAPQAPQSPAAPSAAGPAAAATAPAGAPSPAPALSQEAPAVNASPEKSPVAKTEVATFAGGCFWCIEAVFEQLPGVVDVRSGFMGGTTANPTYREVCTEDTGHAEVVQVTFDPAKVSYDALLDWFWKSHDPTSLNRQGADEGPQYRSAVFFHSPEQKVAAERSKAAAQKAFADPIVTEITEAGAFTEAEGYHQDYYRQNRAAPYCRAVIQPKLKKLGLKE